MTPTPNNLEIGRATVELREQLKVAIRDVSETALRRLVSAAYDPSYAEHQACMLVDDVVFRAFRLWVDHGAKRSAAPAKG